MKKNDMFKNMKGEVVVVVEVDEVRKTCMIQLPDGKTRDLSFSTLKDKRRWTPVDVKAETDLAGDGTPLAEVGKEIAEQAKQKAKEELKKAKKANNIAKASKLAKTVAEKKSSKKNLIEYNGKALTLHGWAKELNVPFGTLYARVTRFNWTYEEALSGKKNK